MRVSDVAVYGSHLRALLRTYNAHDLDGYAVGFAFGVGSFHKGNLALVVTLGNLVPFSVFVLLIVVRARGDAILQSYEFFGLIGFGSELTAVHNRVHKFVGRFETERKQCEVVKRVLFVNDNQHFVIRRRPFGVAEQLVLRLDEVFVFNHLVPHGQQRAELFDFVEEAAE